MKPQTESGMISTVVRDLESLTVPQLLTLHAGITDELRRRGITRSANNPLGDLAEHLFCNAFSWRMAEKSMRDCDAIGECGTRYQIKSRRITSRNPSRQLGALRSLHERNFDILAAALFNEDFSVMRAALIPHERVVELAKRVEHTNSWRFMLTDSVWSLPGVQDVTRALRSGFYALEEPAYHD